MQKLSRKTKQKPHIYPKKKIFSALQVYMCYMGVCVVFCENYNLSLPELN